MNRNIPLDLTFLLSLVGISTEAQSYYFISLTLIFVVVYCPENFALID